MHLWNGHRAKALLVCPHIMILFVNDFIHSSIPNSASFRDTVTTGWSLYNNTLSWTFNFVIYVIWGEIQLFSRIIYAFLVDLSGPIHAITKYLTDLNIISCIWRFQIKIYKYIKCSICLAKCNQYSFIYIKHFIQKCITNNSWEISPSNIGSLNAVILIKYLLIKFLIK